MMDKWDIAFPHLGIYLEHFPKSFTVFGFTIALYGVIIALGVLFGFTLAIMWQISRGFPKIFCGTLRFRQLFSRF